MIGGKVHRLLPVLLLCIFGGCQNTLEDTLESDIVTIKVPSEYDDIIFDQQYVKSIKFLPLETKQECLINKITHLTYQNDKFFVFDLPMKSLLVFNSNGEFLFKLKVKGRGPGEFSELRDFKVDKDGNIYILANQRILQYSKTGEFKKSKSFNFIRDQETPLFPLQFALDHDGGFYLWQGTFGYDNLNNKELHAMYMVNKDLKIKKEYLSIVRPIRGMTNRFFGDYNNTRMQTVRGNDTIYCISDLGFHSKFYIDFGNRKLPDNYLPESFNKMGRIYSEIKDDGYSTLIVPYAETDKYLYFEFQSDRKWVQALYNKCTTSTKVGIRNYTNLFSSIIRCNYDNQLVSSVEPNRIISGEFSFQSKYDIRLLNYEVLEEIKPHDNPILILYNLD